MEAGFLSRVWIDLAGAARVPQETVEQLQEALSVGEVVLEPGCLGHLASTADALPKNPGIDDLVRKAREEAADLGRALANEGNAMEELLAALAIGCTPAEPIAIPEIAFLASLEESRFPGKSSDFSTLESLSKKL